MDFLTERDCRDRKFRHFRIKRTSEIRRQERKEQEVLLISLIFFFMRIYLYSLVIHFLSS